MSRVTYHVALPFIRAADGTLTPEQAVECPSPNAAMRAAGRMVGKHPGAVAFSRTGDPDVGEFDPAEVLATFGEVPEDLSEL